MANVRPIIAARAGEIAIREPRTRAKSICRPTQSIAEPAVLLAAPTTDRRAAVPACARSHAMLDTPIAMGTPRMVVRARRRAALSIVAGATRPALASVNKGLARPPHAQEY